MDFATHVPQAVRWIAGTLEDGGFETWVVGGAIRDVLLGLPAGDWDLATRATPPEIMALFRRTVPIGVEHGTVGVLVRDGTLYEVTTFRRDVRTFGRRAVVEFADVIEEDLARRDFTLNAIAWHPLRGDLLDPAGGVADLEARILRTVGDPAERFSEDFLRVLRALRFSGQFGFDIQEETWAALRDAVEQLRLLSAERVQEELMKVLSNSEKPSVALGLYARSGALEALYPELVEAVRSAPTPGLDRALLACDAVRPTRPLVRFAALLSPLALRSSEDAALARVAVERLMERLRFSNAATKRVGALVATLTMELGVDEPSEVRRWLHRSGPEHFPDVARIWIAQARAASLLAEASEPSASEAPGLSPAETTVRRIRAVRSVLRANPPLHISALALNGEHLHALGLAPGPRFREILESLLDRVLEEPEMNTLPRLEALVRQGGLLSEQWEPGGEPEGHD